jgi:hypothetical protein
VTWHHVACIGIDARGRPCNRRHQVEIPITFEWDPVAGRGIGAPSAPLCRLHDYLWDLEPHERVEIAHGWLGRAWNPGAGVWTVMTTVYETRDGLAASPHWWALRRATRFGDCSRVVYGAP